MMQRKKRLQKSAVIDNFKKGDLLYGLESVRRYYRPKLRKAINDQKYPITIDDYNNKVLFLLKPEGQWSEAGEVDASNYVSNPKESGLSSQDKAAPYKEHIRILKNTSLTKLNIKRNDYPKNIKGLSNTTRSIIRICKLAILEYPKEKKCTIHFLLDNIDLHHVIDRHYSMSKSAKSLNREGSALYDTVTSAEIRFILKNYEAILKQKSSLKFYQNEKEVDFLDWILNQSKETKEALVSYANSKKLITLLALLEPKNYDLEDSSSEVESKISESEVSSERELLLSPLSEEYLPSPISHQPITPAKILTGQAGSGPGQGVFHSYNYRDLSDYNSIKPEISGPPELELY